MRAILAVFLLVILTSCDNRDNFSEQRQRTEYLASVSPVKENDIGVHVVELNFTREVCATCDFVLNASGTIWQAFPVSKISTDIIGKHVGKNITLKYYLVRPQTLTQPPLVYVIDLTVSE